MCRVRVNPLFHTAMMLGAFLVSGAQTEGQPAKPKAAATPEEAVKCLLEAAKADDVDAFQAQLGAHTRAVMEMGRAMEAYQAALEEKFGKGSRPGDKASVKKKLERFKTKTFQIRSQAAKDKGRVALTVWEITKKDDGKESISEETWVSIKEPTGWKIIFPEAGVTKEAVRAHGDGKEVKVRVLQSRELDAKARAAEEKMWLDAKQILDRLTKDVKAGKYQSREQAEAALQEAKSQQQKQEK